MANIASSSRQCWAFARDHGFPCSDWIKRVEPRRQLPLNALIVCGGVSFILAAINFGSNVAFNAIVSVSNAALVFSYIVSMAASASNACAGSLHSVDAGVWVNSEGW